MNLRVLLFCVFWGLKSFAQITPCSFEKLDSIPTTNRKTTMVFIHTDWCKYCNILKMTTLKDKQVIELLNKQFHFIDFNATTTNTIYFNQQKFEFIPNGLNQGTHQLAIALGQNEGDLTFPTLCFLNEHNEIIHQVFGYINAKDLVKILQILPSTP